MIKMFEDEVNVDGCIAYLNQLLIFDREAITKLFTSEHIPCNKDLLNHPTVQCVSLESGPAVRFIGILNGLFGTIEIDGKFKNYGKITIVQNTESGEIMRFERTAR